MLKVEACFTIILSLLNNDICMLYYIFVSFKEKQHKKSQISLLSTFCLQFSFFRHFLMDFRCGSNFADDDFRDILDNLNFVDEILCDICGGLLSTEKNIIHEICEIQSGRKFIYLREFGTTL